ncbi:MAG TPA: hypothetical protein VGT41_00845 [Candidatus Babeliales bacterium]|nr:hypothetical protein [Candidatus Babeliales bacterium]
MKNIYTLFLLTSVIIVSIAIFIFCKKSSKTGTVIVLNGTGSSGKTSISKLLQKQLQDSVTLSIDDILWPAFKKEAQDLALINPQMSKEQIEQIIIENVNVLSPKVQWLMVLQQLYDQARFLARTHQYVILDTVFGIVDRKDYDYFVQQMQGLTSLVVLVYCDPLHLAHHIVARNAGAKKEEMRDMLVHMRGFEAMYAPATLEDVVVETVTKQDVEYALRFVHDSLPEMGKSQAQVEQQVAEVRDLYFKTFFPDDMHEVQIASRFAFDMFVNTGNLSSQECVQLILSKSNHQNL